MRNQMFDMGVHRPVYLWAGPGTVRMNRLKFMNAPVDEAVHMRWQLVRRLGDRLRLPQLMIQSPYFSLPPVRAQKSLLAALGERLYPCVLALEPVLAEVWRRDEYWQLHLVNYAPEAQSVIVDFGGRVATKCLSPDSGAEIEVAKPIREFDGARLALDLDVYAVLEYTLQIS